MGAYLDLDDVTWHHPHAKSQLDKLIRERDEARAAVERLKAEADGTPSMTVEAGEFTQLPPGYKFTSWDPNYPSDVFDSFTRACLRGIAAGVGVSYESLSRDYSQSNYSSLRLSLYHETLQMAANQASTIKQQIGEVVRYRYLKKYMLYSESHGWFTGISVPRHHQGLDAAIDAAMREGD